MVIYEEEKFLGKITTIKNGQAQVRCLEKPLGINSPQDFEREADAIFYEDIYKTDITPMNVQIGRKFLREY